MIGARERLYDHDWAVCDCPPLERRKVGKYATDSVRLYRVIETQRPYGVREYRCGNCGAVGLHWPPEHEAPQPDGFAPVEPVRLAATGEIVAHRARKVMAT